MTISAGINKEHKEDLSTVYVMKRFFVNTTTVHVQKKNFFVATFGIDKGLKCIL